MGFIITLLINSLAVFITAYIFPNVYLKDFVTAIAVAIILGITNTLLRPILLVLTLPINIMTLGLFTFVINALIILIVSGIVPGFKVTGFIQALLFSLVLSVVNSFLHSLTK